MTFPGQQPGAFFFFPLLPPMQVAPSYKHVITLSLCLRTWQTNNFTTCYFELHRFLAGGAMSVQTENEAGHRERKPSCTSFYLLLLCTHGFVPGPSQLLCLPRGLDTMAQLAPTGCRRRPGTQPKQSQKTVKKATKQ